MSVEGFDEIFNTVYIAKSLYDMNRYALVKDSFYDEISFDTYIESMLSLIENLFEYHHCRYSDRNGYELHIISDSVIEDFYELAGEYGRRNDISDENNYYIKQAEQQVRIQLDFSYCIDWRLVGYTKTKRKYHSRLAVFIYQDDWVDLGCLAYALIEIYCWFSEACVNLRKILNDLGKEEKAA